MLYRWMDGPTRDGQQVGGELQGMLFRVLVVVMCLYISLVVWAEL